jgi:N-methylhydantoinase B
LPGKITTTVAKDTLIIHEQAGAGGFGNPLLRAPEHVREDFLDGKITAAFAERHYAVRFGARGALDVEATARLRLERAATPELSGPPHGA